MLVLTRKVSQAIIIAGTIEVKILGVNGNQVRVGIKAPDDITIHRDEVQVIIDEEKQIKINEC